MMEKGAQRMWSDCRKKIHCLLHKDTECYLLGAGKGGGEGEVDSSVGIRDIICFKRMLSL